MENWLRRKFHVLQWFYDQIPYSLKWVGVSLRGFALTRIRYSPRFWNILHEIEAREGWSKVRMHNFQVQQLQNMIQHAYNSTHFYRERFDEAGVKPKDIHGLSDLSRLPILERQDIRRRWRDMISMEVPTNRRIIHRTSGTTGAGINVIVSPLALQTITAYISRQMLWAGVKPRDWRLTMFGARIIPPNQNRPPYWVKNLPGRQIFISGFHLSDNSIKHYYTFLKRHQHLPIEGFASILHILSELLAQKNLKVEMKAIFSNGEPLMPNMRALIEERLGAKVWDAYGQTELVGLIQECEMGGFHLAPDFGILEIIDEEGNPVQSDQPGAFVWTGLQNKAMPLIRYKIGDTGAWCENQVCLCGRATPLVLPLITRDSDYLRTPEGKIYSPRMVNQLLKDTDFQSCQFVQESSVKWIVRYIPSNDMADKQAEIVRSNLEQLLGFGCYVDTQKADKPIQRQGGKIPLILVLD